MEHIKSDEGYHIMIKGSIQQEEIIINPYSPKARTPSFVKQILIDLKRRNGFQYNDSVGPSHSTNLSGQTRQKLSKETTEHTQSTEQMDLIDIYRIFHGVNTE